MQPLLIIMDNSKDTRIAHLRFKRPGISSPGMPSEPLPSIPLVVPTRNIKLPHAGLYRLFVRVDTQETGHLEFKATQAPSDPLKMWVLEEVRVSTPPAARQSSEVEQAGGMPFRGRSCTKLARSRSRSSIAHDLNHERSSPCY